MTLESHDHECMSGETSGVATSAAYELLARGRRRRVLDHLRDADDAIHLAELAEAVAAVEADGDPADDHVARVETSLYHAHLPKLDDAGVVQFSTNPGRVSLGDDADAVFRFIDETADVD